MSRSLHVFSSGNSRNDCGASVRGGTSPASPLESSLQSGNPPYGSWSVLPRRSGSRKLSGAVSACILCTKRRAFLPRSTTALPQASRIMTLNDRRPRNQTAIARAPRVPNNNTVAIMGLSLSAVGWAYVSVRGHRLSLGYRELMAHRSEPSATARRAHQRDCWRGYS
jgi:hypothetical protein